MQPAPEPHAREKAYLLATFQGILEPAGFARAAMPPDGLDWTYVLEVGKVHRLLGLFGWLMERTGRDRALEPGVRRRLRFARMHAAGNHIHHLERFRSLAVLLARAGIPVAPLKGVALARTVYRDLPVRDMMDIDLLVRVEDRKAALALLPPRCAERFEHSRNRWHDDILAINTPNGRWPLGTAGDEVDLHWDPRYTVAGHWTAIDVPRLWARAIPSCDPPGALDPAPADQFRMLALHATDRFHPRLGQLLDLMLVLRADPGSAAELRGWARSALPAGPAEHLLRLVEAIEELVAGAPTLAPPGPASLAALAPFWSATLPEAEDPRFRLLSARSVLALLSWRDRLRFLLGYLVPAPGAYAPAGALRSLGLHWSALATRLRRRVAQHGRPPLPVPAQEAGGPIQR